MEKSLRESRNHERDGGKKDRREDDDTCAARGFANALPVAFTTKDEREQSGGEAIDGQTQSEE